MSGAGGVHANAASRRVDPHLVIGPVFAAFLVGEALILDVPGSRALAVLLALGLGLVFVWQPRAPLLVALGAHVFIQSRIAFDAIPAGSYGFVMAVPLMFFGVGAYGPARGRLLRIAALAVLTAGIRGAWLQWHVDAATTMDEALAQWTFYLALMVLGTGLGLVVRDRGEAVRRLTGRVERLEATLGDTVAEAAAAEQRRISADIRWLVADLVARVDGVLGQAESVAASDPGRAETLLAAAGDSARRAMDRMRETLGRLRADAAPARAVHAGAAALQDLVATLETAGTRVTVEGGRGIALPEILVLAADRVAASAPALLGAAPERATLRLRSQVLELDLRAPPGLGRRRPEATAAVAVRERVRLLGGELRIQPRRGRLIVRLPFAALPVPAAPLRARRLPRPTAPYLAAAVGAVMLLGLADQLGYASDGPLLESLVLALLLPVPLLFSIRWPLPAALSVQALLIAGSAHGTFGGLACEGTLVSLLCAFVFGVQPWPWRRAALLGALTIVSANLAMVVETEPWPTQSYIAFAAMIAGTWGAGRLIRDRLVAADAVREQLDRLAARRRAAEARAAAQERARLAREIHDVVGHAVAVVCIQAGVGERLAATHRPDDARGAIVAARGAAATAARELDRLGELLPDEAGPGLTELPALVERLQAGGMRVELRLVVAEPVAPAIGGAAHRVVQEALTNAAKHAAGAPVTVAVEARDGRLRIDVHNGPGAPRGTDGGGHGVPGMRARVAEHGGTLRAEPRDDGGWTVTARFPLQLGAFAHPSAG